MRLQHRVPPSPARSFSHPGRPSSGFEVPRCQPRALSGHGALALLFSFATLSPSAWATNGDNLIGQGPISRSLGGVGVARPQDGITSISANPAALTFLPSGSSTDSAGKASASQLDFDATLFLPHVEGEINGVSAKGRATIFPIPNFAITTPLNEDDTWEFGLAAYGSSGLGVDYRGTSLDNSRFYNLGGGAVAPLAAGTYTLFSNLKFAPSIAYQFSPKWSAGLGVQVDYATLNVGSGTSSGFSLGTQPGIVFRPTDELSLGLSYTSPQPVNFSRVGDLDGNGSLDSLKLESPQQIAFGAAYELFDHRLLLEADAKWINWGGASGYKDFGWKDQWVLALGAQVEVLPHRLYLRAGYNYGNNPVKTRDNWSPIGATEVQGKFIPDYYYESFRIIGFPAVVESHATIGLGVRASDRLAVNLGYAHAFSNSISESGPNLVGTPTTIKSSLSEDSLEAGLTWRF